MFKYPLTKIRERQSEMVDTIDVHDLHIEEIRFIQTFADFLRKASQKKIVKEKEETTFAVWPLNIKGKLTRKEIYDYL